MNILEGLLQFLLAYVVIGCLVAFVRIMNAEKKRLTEWRRQQEARELTLAGESSSSPAQSVPE